MISITSLACSSKET